VKGTALGTNPNLLFEDGPGPGLEPVGGEFQPSFETGYAGGGAYLIFVLNLTGEGENPAVILGI
jgi:hypothetical protein